MQFLIDLFDTSDFFPRWTCGNWTTGHGLLHIASDLGVWSAYLAIPCVLAYFLLRRRDIPFRLIFVLFGAFILACGTTHLMDALMFWWPAYRLAGVIKFFTAVVSWATVLALIPVVPQVLAMRSRQELEREISERKKTEEALHLAHTEMETVVQRRTAELARANLQLREQQERLRITLASIGDAVITTDTQGRITFLNQVAESLTGWSFSDAEGQPVERVFQIIQEETRQPAENLVVRALHEGVPVGLPGHTVLITKDGTERAIDDSAAPIREEQGNIAGVVLIFRDISERRRAQAERDQAETSLRQSESKLRRLVESNLLGVLYWDASGNITEANDAFLDLVGYTRADLEEGGVRWSEITPVECQKHDEAGMAEAQLRGACSLYEKEFIRKDRSHVRVLVGYALLEGSQTEYICFILDLTTRKRLEAELLHQMDQLKEADHRKDEFLAMLAHELRNPLAPVRNAVQIMKVAAHDSELMEEARQMMDRQVEHMVHLVDDLMDVSRITRGKIELRKERIDLASVVKSAVETSRPQIDAVGHVLEVTLSAEPLYFEADATRIAQVLANLLTNAAKYTRASGHIWLTAEHDGDELVMKVRDTGIGIAPAMLNRIFEMFTQADSALERAQGGLGIGLTLVRRLVEMHGGTVEAHSEGLGFGSEFIVRLPIAPKQPAGQFQQSPESHTAAQLKGRVKRILVVDDNEDSAESLAILLRVMGNEVLLAYDGAKALEIALAEGPDLVLLDLGLPEMNGHDVARRIREHPTRKNLVLAALTGWGSEADRQRSKEAGFNYHLVKPVDFPTLQQLLGSLGVNP